MLHTLLVLREPPLILRSAPKMKDFADLSSSFFFRSLSIKLLSNVFWSCVCFINLCFWFISDVLKLSTLSTFIFAASASLSQCLLIMLSSDHDAAASGSRQVSLWCLSSHSICDHHKKAALYQSTVLHNPWLLSQNKSPHLKRKFRKSLSDWFIIKVVKCQQDDKKLNLIYLVNRTQFKINLPRVKKCFNLVNILCFFLSDSNLILSRRAELWRESVVNDELIRSQTIWNDLKSV